MQRYRQVRDRLQRPLIVICFLLGVGLLAEGIWMGRDPTQYLVAVPTIGGSIIWWLVPSGRRLHPPSESTLQWARKQRQRERG